MDESVIKHLEQPQQVGTLKLSEAIRIGARLRPQSTEGGVFLMVASGKSCALLAAYEVMNGYPRGYELASNDLTAWAADTYGVETQDVVRLNDCEKWTREAIADWLEAKGY